MIGVRVQEINDEGEALEWEGDLLNIAEELLTEFDHPDALGVLKKLQAPRNLGQTNSNRLLWFIGEMNALKNGYTYKGQVIQ